MTASQEHMKLHCFQSPWGARDAKTGAGGQRPASAAAEGQRLGGQGSEGQRDQVRSLNQEVLGHGAKT